MLVMITWMLFWKLYGLAVACLIAIPIIGNQRTRIKGYLAAQQSPKQPREKDRDHSLLPNEIEEEATYTIPPHLKIWEPETPPVIIKVVANTQPRSARNKSKAKTEVHETSTSKKHPVKAKSNLREKPSQQNKVFRMGIRRIAGEMATCLNGVAENTTTEKELYKAMRLVMRQHPGLRSLPYEEALQVLLWTEDDFAALTIMPVPENEGW